VLVADEMADCVEDRRQHRRLKALDPPTLQQSLRQAAGKGPIALRDRLAKHGEQLGLWTISPVGKLPWPIPRIGLTPDTM
jgi:hypothetical protein